MKHLNLQGVRTLSSPTPSSEALFRYPSDHFPLELDAHIHKFCSPDEYYDMCEYERLTRTGNG